MTQSMGTAPTTKADENRIRRAAARQGYALHKSGRRDPRALDYGVWWLTDATADGDPIVDPPGRTSLAAVEAFLNGPVYRTRQILR